MRCSRLFDRRSGRVNSSIRCFSIGRAGCRGGRRMCTGCFNRLDNFNRHVSKNTRVSTRRCYNSRFCIFTSCFGCLVIADGNFVLRLAKQVNVNLARPGRPGCCLSGFGFGFITKSGQLGQRKRSGTHGQNGRCGNEKFFHKVILKKVKFVLFELVP